MDRLKAIISTNENEIKQLDLGAALRRPKRPKCLAIESRTRSGELLLECKRLSAYQFLKQASYVIKPPKKINLDTQDPDLQDHNSLPVRSQTLSGLSYPVSAATDHVYTSNQTLNTSTNDPTIDD